MAGDPAWARFLEIVLHHAGFNTPVRITVHASPERTRPVDIGGYRLMAIAKLAEQLVTLAREHQERLYDDEVGGRKVAITALEESPQSASFVLVALQPDLLR